MARPIKLGLDYFPLDVDIFMNLKIRKLIKKFGCKGVYIFFTILCDIYKNGYYLSVDEDYIFDLSDRSGIDIDELNKLFDYMTKLGLFNMKLFKSDLVFTSETIQKRFFLAKQNTFGKIICELPYLLMNVNKNASDTSECADNLTIDENKEEVSIELMPQSKEKYSRVLKEKEKKNKGEGESKTLSLIAQTRSHECESFPPLSDLWINSLLKDKNWIKSAIAVANSKDVTAENIFEKLNDFRDFIITTGDEDTVTIPANFKRRFFYWMKKNGLVNKYSLENSKENKVPPATNNSYKRKPEEEAQKPLSIVKQMLKEKCTKKK
jgi:hypothetical protein